MLKLIIHIAVAAAIIYVARANELGLLATFACLVAGAFVVHVLWERLLGTPRSGVVDVREDDPLMLEAIDEAKRTWPQFIELYSQYREHTMMHPNVAEISLAIGGKPR